MLKEIPIETWKLYIARAYLIPSLQYLPPPYDEMDYEFFGREAEGQKEKMPQMRLLVNIVYNYCTDIFSELFWEKEGSTEIEESVKKFVNDIIQATKRRIEDTTWLKEVTQNKAIRKIDAMRLEIVKPNTFPSYTTIELFDDNLLKNIFLLGKEKTKSIVERAGHPYRYWEEGIYRVNAYYFSENNEIMIPYGTTLPPFYSVKGDLSWNAGALGSIIGHEICHAFDEDGHLYDEKGNKSNWWKRSDNIAYNRKTKDLIKLYSKQKINGKNVNGRKTLSENIADLGGVGIALELVKEKCKDMAPEQRKKYLQEFFIAFAVSWRTRYRTEKLERALELDSHSPAFLRVNLVVSQFDEWYEAFDIDSSSPSYRKPEDRIRIF
jgi:putative endopeptidase